MKVFEALALEGRLLCPETRAPVAVRSGRIVSPSGRDLGPVSGPLNFLCGYRDTLDPASVPKADVERMRATLELPPDPGIDAGIAEAIAATGARFGQQHLSAEAQVLAERFRMPAFEVNSGTALTAIWRRVVGRVRSRLGPRAQGSLDHVSSTVGDRLTSGEDVYRSMRVRNGATTLNARARPAAAVVTQFARADGAPLVVTRMSNALPVDLEPGREITLILRLRPPATTGTHRLRAWLEIEGLPRAPFFDREVELIACELPIFAYEHYPDVLEYGADHHVAMLELADYLRSRPGGPSRILEIGGGVHPTGHSIALLGHQVVSADISHSQSILGTLYFRTKMPQLDESLGFVSCDGLDLPFGEAAFDGAMLVAAFHHFADPGGLLRELKRVVKPGGFIYLACETCAPNPADPQYLEELRRGINEQMWTLAELTEMFRNAALRVLRARVDGHSLKVTLATG